MGSVYRDVCQAILLYRSSSELTGPVLEFLFLAGDPVVSLCFPLFPITQNRLPDILFDLIGANSYSLNVTPCIIFIETLILNF